MSERKLIQFNPELFKIPEKKRRRVKSSGATAKSPKPKIIPKQNKTLKNSVLRMIRNKQQESYKELFQKGTANPIPASPPPKHKDVQTFHNDFEESLNFATDFIERQQNAPFKNKTLKQPPSEMLVNTILPTNIFDNVYSQLPMPTTKSSIILNKPVMPTSAPLARLLPPAPKWGCLKGGNLMTYRNFHNKTAKQYPSLATVPCMTSAPVPQTPTPTPIPYSGGALQILDSPAQKLQKMKEHKPMKPHAKLKYKKRKKTLKRTYVVGKSKYFPKIGVLVSNQTIRNKTTEKMQLMKQTPLADIRKFLIKRGFIKIGTPAPNDLLRKMYETVHLVCGEIQNHNPDNLLYNFLNDR